MLKIGLTGGIGSGKSTAADFFRSQHIDVIDLDQVARDVVRKGSSALGKIQERFGKEILNKNGDLDRKKLGEIIFSNNAEKLWVESLLHPLINAEMEETLKSNTSTYVVIESPLLTENKRQNDFDRVLVIDCNGAALRGHQSEEQVKRIVDLQASRAERKALADDIVENNGSNDELTEKLADLHQKYLILADS